MNNLLKILLLIFIIVVCMYLLSSSCNFNELFTTTPGNSIKQVSFNSNDTINNFDNKLTNLKIEKDNDVIELNRKINTTLNNITSFSALSGTINNITTNTLFFTANGSISNLSNLYVDNINFSQNGTINNLNTLKTSNLTTTSLLSDTGSISNLTTTSLLSDTGMFKNLSSPSSNIDTLNIGTFNFKQIIKDNKKTLELKQGDNILAAFTSEDPSRVKLYTDNNNNININNLLSGVKQGNNNYTFDGNLNINGTLKVGNNITIKSDASGDVITIGNRVTSTHDKTRINIGKFTLVPVIQAGEDYINLTYNTDGVVNNDKNIVSFSRNAWDRMQVHTSDNPVKYFYVNKNNDFGLHPPLQITPAQVTPLQVTPAQVTPASR
jgi:hypothetical protein